MVLWYRRGQVKPWYIVVPSSGESAFADGVNEHRQNLVLRLSHLLALMACITHSHIGIAETLTNTMVKIPLKLMTAFSLSCSVFKAKIPSIRIEAPKSI